MKKEERIMVYIKEERTAKLNKVNIETHAKFTAHNHCQINKQITKHR